MTTAHRIVLGNNQTHVFASPPPWGPLGYPQIIFTATDPSHPGTALLGLPGAYPPMQQTWHFQSIVADGWSGHEVYGVMNFRPQYAGAADIQGMHVSHGDVTLGTGNGNRFVLNGVETITNYSTLIGLGGRYAAIGLGGDSYILNGNMNVSNRSVVNFNSALLSGHGTIDVESGSAVDVRTIVAGLHAHVGNGAALRLLYPNSSGTINLAAGGAVYIGGATTATREIFHQASGTLDLLDKSGTQVASLKFAPGSHEYTSTIPIHGGLLEITTNPMMVGNLHTTFVS